MNRIALGGAQFGFDYGITNKAGKVGEEDAGRIMALAAASGIDTIDTSRSYGESERIIGSHWPGKTELRVVTKTAKFSSASDPAAAARQIAEDLDNSLAALARTEVHGLLLHDAQDLLGAMGPRIWAELNRHKGEGRASRIGVSAYESEEVDRILDDFPIDIIQLPFNAIDRRLIEGGQLEKLTSRGVEVHARSVFLQGLLLAEAEAIPFEPIREAVEELDQAFAMQGVTRLEGLLATTFQTVEIDRFLFGVTSTAELNAILEASKRAQEIGPLDLDLPSIDPRFLNPSRWPELPKLG